MKKHIKKLISSLMAISLAAPIFSGIPVFAENSDGTIVEQTQALTVVGKRIKGDDTYFEISLEVNDDYDKYSSVGVVLRYDPDYIIPAESWDEGAGAADMSENTTWATRRALPTLGLETWSTHTALAYQEDTPATGSGGKKYGYLYLGAEHPLTVEGTSDSSASPDSSDSSESDPASETSPEPGTRPVVVARFMYKTDETVSGKTTKDNLVDAWINGTNNSGAVQLKGSNWDYDWTANKILTIASDEVAGKSPAQYPFAIYTQDYEEKAFMRTWPTVTPTVTPAPGAPTPTPMPISAYAPEIGAGVDPANHLTRNDIMIITCEGESAKAQGGLKLSDIYVILFFDWDDTLIGTLTAGVGAEGMNTAVSNYVKETMIHPDLQDDTTHLSSLDRTYTYRGAYPHTGPRTDGGDVRLPGGSDTVIDGEQYPLTNKLEYVFAGKTFYADAPYAGGWTEVNTSTMSSTYTWLDRMQYNNKAFNRIDKDTGIPLDDSGVPDATLSQPDFVSCNFDEYELKPNQTTVTVKAVYWPGTQLDIPLSFYTPDDNASYELLTELGNEDDRVYSVNFTMRRISSSGIGVSKTKIPKINMSMKQEGALNSAPVQVDSESKEVFDVFLPLSNGVEKIGYQLKETDESNVISGLNRTIEYPDKFTLDDFRLICNYKRFLKEVREYSRDPSKYGLTVNETDLETFGFGYTYAAKTGKVTYATSKTLATLVKRIGYYMDAYEAHFAGDPNPPEWEDLTWYQIQYAIFKCTSAKNATYLSPNDAKSQFLTNYASHGIPAALTFLDADGKLVE